MVYRSFKKALLLSVAASGIAAATPALAQDSASASAAGDIIVTARRVEERLQDVPISITVFNQDELTKRNIAVATDLAAYTPSLSVNQRYGPEKSSFSIRGFTQDQSTAPTVGVYFAEVVGVRAQGGTTSGNTVGAGAFTDLENVQVLKGPQGTLFGRNTTGGAILLTPKKPTDNLEGYIEGTYGNYDQMRLQGALNIPLADTFKVRLAGERNKRDGYIKNVSGIGPKDYNDVDYTYLRLSIVAELTPDLENYTIFHYSDSSTNGYATKITGCDTPISQGGTLLTDNILPAGSTPDPVTGLVNPAYSGTRHLQALSCGIQLARQDARGDGLYDVETANPNPFLDIVQWQVINTTTWNVSDNITIKNIMSYGEFRERANFDLGSSNFEVPITGTSPIFGPGFDLTRISQRLNVASGAIDPVTKLALGPALYAAAGTPYQRIVLDTAAPNVYNSSQSTFTEELQVQGQSTDGRLNFVLGGYLEFSRPIGFNAGRTGIFLDCTRPQNLECANPLFFGSISESHTKLSFDNHGIFGQATYNFTDQLALTAGARYTFDKIKGLQDSTRASFSANAGTGPLFADPLTGVMIARACTDSFRHGPLALALAGLSPPDADRSVCTTNLTNKSNKPTWVINLDYKPTPDILVYAKYARGYRQGGMNFTNPGVELWDPEKLDSYELGLKTSFRGTVSGYFNLAGFYNDLSNQQFFAGLTPTPEAAALGVAGGAAIVNAGSSRVYGLEADASVLFFDSLRLSAGYTYLNTKVKDVASAATQGDGTPLGDLLIGTPFGVISPRVQVGSPFNDTPKHKLTLTGAYTLPLDASIGDITIGATWVHASSYINDGSVPASAAGFGLGVSPSTDLVNLNLDWKAVAGSPIDLAFFATNVTKEKYNVASTGAWNSAGVAEVLLNQPRFYGVRVRYNFGQ
ncbi:MAG: TonB-dependent receptor [Novosphingobium sp.]|nr:TonB-dependent receptor [Novosphingobium sp.]